MKYEDRKKCGLLKSDGSLHCPLSESIAGKDCSCDTCELFELHLRFKQRSMILRLLNNQEDIK